MSFQIVLMENSSPSNKVDKTVANIATATGVLREGTSVVDPEVEIESVLEQDIISRVNYARIEAFHRFYFVTDITLDITGLWLFTMHCDVLMSYKEAIKQQNAVVARQERRYNMYLDDGWFMTYQNPIVRQQYFSVSAPFEGESYILVLAGS